MVFKITIHALRMIFTNFSSALKIALVPFVLSQLVGLGFYYFLTGQLFASQAELQSVLMTDGYGKFLLGMLVMLVLSIVLMAWIAVGWHRFVLLEEYPNGFLPKWHGDQTKAYIGKILLLMLILMGLGFVGGLVAGLLGALLAVAIHPLAVVVPMLLVYLAMLWIFTRLSLVLPSVSIGNPMGFGEAWEHTKPMSGTILGVAILSGIVIYVPAALQFIAPENGVFIAIVSFVVGFFGVLLGASVLTTIYGIIIEKRELT
ncbi:MAG: hypothetical protein ACPGRD_02325 [Planktomarina sp.]